jgi:hypothetical protein
MGSPSLRTNSISGVGTRFKVLKVKQGERKQIQFGAGDVIRLSAENGPVSVKAID